MSALKPILSKQSSIVNFQLSCIIIIIILYIDNGAIESVLPIIGSTFIHYYLCGLNLSSIKEIIYY